VVLAEGDLNSDQLGLSAGTMQQLLEQVDIIIHSAASIGRFACVCARACRGFFQHAKLRSCMRCNSCCANEATLQRQLKQQASS
jgi:hypothetical protein